MGMKERIPNVKEWFKNRYFRKRASKDIEVIIRSIGGAGSTTIINYLSNYKKCNSPVDHDGLKHARKADIADGQKQLIIISDPHDIYRSLEHRYYLRINCLKLGFISYFVKKKSIFLNECNQLQMKWISDLGHRDDTLILHYNELFESAERIQRHLDISEDTFTRFFPVRRRRSSQN